VISWLKRLLGLDWFEHVDVTHEMQQAQIDDVRRHLDVVEQWVSNLDSAIWRIEQKQRAAAPAEPEPLLTDLKALSEKIRDEMSRKKAAFPTSLEQLK
jgi:hypothetical protein